MKLGLCARLQAARWLARQKDLYLRQKLLRIRVRQLKEALGGWRGKLSLSTSYIISLCMKYEVRECQQTLTNLLWRAHRRAPLCA